MPCTACMNTACLWQTTDSQCLSSPNRQSSLKVSYTLEKDSQTGVVAAACHTCLPLVGSTQYTIMQTQGTLTKMHHMLTRWACQTACRLLLPPARHCATCCLLPSAAACLLVLPAACWEASACAAAITSHANNMRLQKCILSAALLPVACCAAASCCMLPDVICCRLLLPRLVAACGCLLVPAAACCCCLLHMLTTSIDFHRQAQPFRQQTPLRHLISWLFGN
jgi:hypothetical protein